MVKHMRIDNRLIHGQVANAWVNYIYADVIVVCNDKVAVDPIQKMTLPMAARGFRTEVLSIADTIAFVNDNPDLVVFIIAKHPSDALALLESGMQIEEVNVGNAAPIVGTEYKMVCKSIACTPDEAVVYRKIAELNGELTSQMLPSNSKEDFIKILSDNDY